MRAKGVRGKYGLGLNLLQWAQRTELVRVLRKNLGNRSATMRECEIACSTLYHLIKLYQISPEEWQA